MNLVNLRDWGTFAQQLSDGSSGDLRESKGWPWHLDDFGMGGNAHSRVKVCPTFGRGFTLFFFFKGVGPFYNLQYLLINTFIQIFM